MTLTIMRNDGPVVLQDHQAERFFCRVGERYMEFAINDDEADPSMLNVTLVLTGKVFAKMTRKVVEDAAQMRVPRKQVAMAAIRFVLTHRSLAHIMECIGAEPVLNAESTLRIPSMGIKKPRAA